MAKYSQIREHLWAKALSRNPQQVDSNNPPVLPSESKLLHKTGILSTSAVKSREKKISKAYFPNSTQRAGHLLQRVIRRYPFFAQQSGSDCGAACLVMVSRYWGKNFSVNRLRDIANVDRNGSSLRGLSAAAESIGFSTRPVKASLDQLAKQKLPVIAHWEGKHYIVVYKITPKYVIVADPAIGQRTLSHAEFKANWTGYTLLLQPTAMLKDAKETSTPFWQFFELMKPHSLVMLEVFIASLFIQIFGLVTPLFTQLILDRVVVQRSELTLTAVGLGLLIFSLFRVAMTGLRQYLLDHTANKLDLALIVGFIRHTLRLPLSYFEFRYVGDIISRVQENRKIQRFLSGEALSILLDLVTIFIYLGLMFWYSWQMALLVLVIVPPFFLLALIATPFLQKISREIFNAVANESSYLIEALSGVRTVKSTAVEQTVRWHWEELLSKEVKTNFSGQIISNRLQIFSNTIEAKVLIDGQDISSLSLRSLREQVGVVDQDTFLFGGTIRENISLAHPGATLAEIIEAARLAGADEFIKKLPMGYETQIGEGGGMLSGGQRQRIAIAKALLGNPKLLILDEATSHLDAESERIIQTNLNTILQGRTTLVIAHRLSTVRNADLILVLDRGVLIESGTHKELMTKRGHYFYLNHQQIDVAGETTG
jgi:ATP-binding cassette subfamily B protein